MTCIVGLIDNGTVWMGGDSAVIRSRQLRRCVEPKVFRNGHFLFGFTTSFRMGQLLAHVFKPPAPPSGGRLERFLASTFIDTVRDCLSKGGFAKKTDETESGGEFLLGIRSRLFCVYSDYTVSESPEEFNAIGCGAEFAMGSLFATAKMPARRRVFTALRAAEHLCTDVIGPFKIRHLKPERRPQ